MPSTTQSPLPEAFEPVRRESGICVRGAEDEGVPSLPNLQSHIVALCDEGAERVDPVGMQHAKRLVQRVQLLSGAGQDFLCRRLHDYLLRLQQRIDAEREQAEQHADRLCSLSLVAPSQAKALMAEGNFQRLRQLARRYPEQAPRLREQLRAQWRASLDAEAERRGLSSPGTLDAPTDDDQQLHSPAELASALYRDTATSALAALTIAKAVSALPEGAGRYHAATVATRALQAMQVAPSYLKAQLERLECLAAMDALEPAAELAAQETRGAKRRSRTRKPTSSRTPSGVHDEAASAVEGVG